MKKVFSMVELLVALAIVSVVFLMYLRAETSLKLQERRYTVASYYDSDIMACASRDFKVGTLLRVTHNGKTILVPVTSVGPSQEMYAKGRHLDLSKLAFSQFDNPDVGLIEVTVEEK